METKRIRVRGGIVEVPVLFKTESEKAVSYYWIRSDVNPWDGNAEIAYVFALNGVAGVSRSAGSVTSVAFEKKDFENIIPITKDEWNDNVKFTIENIFDDKTIK